MINADTAFGKIARPFFNGVDNDYRNKRFKLIPKVREDMECNVFLSIFLFSFCQVIEGNTLMKAAVKNKPVILGTKLKQFYYHVSGCHAFLFL
jgi:hypothetical protein